MKYCCENCFDDDLLKQFIRSYDTKNTCDFCRSTDVYVSDVNDVGEFIKEGINRKYEDAANSVGYCSREGGYLLPTLSIEEILNERECIFSILIDDPYQIMEELVDLDGTLYVRQNPYSDPPSGIDIFESWQYFCKVIKTKRRFTLFNKFSNIPDEKLNHFLSTLELHLELEFLASIEPSTIVYRSRLGDFMNHIELTSPPH